MVNSLIGFPLHLYSTSQGTDANGNFQSNFHVGAGGILMSALVVLAYGTLFCGSKKGQTLGMMVAKTKVINATDGQPIGYGKALGRAALEYLMSVVFFLPWVLDMLWPLWDNRNQTLHDKATGTVVTIAVRLHRRPRFEATRLRVAGPRRASYGPRRGATARRPPAPGM